MALEAKLLSRILEDKNESPKNPDKKLDKTASEQQLTVSKFYVTSSFDSEAVKTPPAKTLPLSASQRILPTVLLDKKLGRSIIGKPRTNRQTDGDSSDGYPF